MDLICPRCEEPWDIDCLHEETEERMDATGTPRENYGQLFDTVKDEFMANGCIALATAYGMVKEDCEPTNSARAATIAVLYDAFGHDMDGVASDIEDFISMGML